MSTGAKKALRRAYTQETVQQAEEYFLAGRSRAEIGTMMGIPVSTLSTWQRRFCWAEKRATTVPAERSGEKRAHAEKRTAVFPEFDEEIVNTLAFVIQQQLSELLENPHSLNLKTIRDIKACLDVLKSMRVKSTESGQALTEEHADQLRALLGIMRENE